MMDEREREREVEREREIKRMCRDKASEIERVRHTHKQIGKTGDIENFLCKAERRTNELRDKQTITNIMHYL